jgi:putative ubiquitin-RnfH superfamily antitoxin RatB of RatAB toxin-antitoxin module
MVKTMPKTMSESTLEATSDAMHEKPARKIHVEVAFAIPGDQIILGVDVQEGTTVEQAIHLSGIISRFPQIDLESNKVGIFGKLTKLTQMLGAGDRVEIYRPLIADPKEVRRKRAQAGKVMKKGAAAAEDKGPEDKRAEDK